MDMTKYEEYWEAARATYFENWPEGLMNHSIATVLIELTDQERLDLLDMNMMSIEDVASSRSLQEFKAYCRERQDRLHNLITRITKVITQFPHQKAFVKLSSRSPKDSWRGIQEGFECTLGAYAIDLLNSSERVWDDLHLQKSHSYPTFLAVREWKDIDPHLEFRVIKIGDHLSISQYDYTRGSWTMRPGGDPNTIWWVIRKFYVDIKHMLPDDVVFDVFLDLNYQIMSASLTTPQPDAPQQFGTAGHVSWKCTLIELNPVMIWTDPCLFDWNKDSFDHDEFRYLGGDKEVIKVRL